MVGRGKFLLKLDFTTNYTDGPRRRFRNLTKVWSSKESLSVSLLVQGKKRHSSFL